MTILKRKLTILTDQERIETKLDWLCYQINRIEYEKFKKDLEKQYPKK